ncbi:MAG: PAS domain S-box protein [Cyclobacteriaceae bacterium]|nr:PAS domain S-box protein [Cyclobacteriaceae bacterium]
MPDKKPLEISFVSSDTFREIFQTSAEGIIMVDAVGKILLANPVSEKMFGYEQGTLVGHKLEDLLPERLRVMHLGFRKGFNDAPSPRRMGIGRDLQALRLDGTEFPVEISLSYTRMNDQLLSMAFITDISQRKVAEDRLKKSEEQLIEYAGELEKKVQSRTEALNMTVTKLEKANADLQHEIRIRQEAEEETRKALEKERELNELKSKFVSIASHEFRTPLSSILSSTSLIKQYRDRSEPEKMDKHIERIKSSVQHLTTILNDFLSLGKLEEGRMEIIKEELTLASFFNEMNEEMKPILKANQHLIISNEQGQETFVTDAKILRSILFNLVSNASKYSPEGKDIVIEIKKTKDTIAIDVKDEGIGIPAAEVKHIFDRFFRATNSSTIQGTGLGLNIVKRYVELLEGTIRFSSKEGAGSTFSITLPNQ